MSDETFPSEASQEILPDETSHPLEEGAATGSSDEGAEPVEALEEPPQPGLPEKGTEPELPPARPARPTEPARRSWGRILRIDEEGAAWLADFRPFGREVLVRLKNAYQANPGQILEYELKASGPGRWSGVDVAFNRPAVLEGVLALDEGRGLSTEGLDFVKRAIAKEAGALKAVFGPGAPPRVGRQLLEDVAFPLPRALLVAALRHPALAGAAARRLQGGPLRDPVEFVALWMATPPREEGALLRNLLDEHAEWLLEPLPLPAESRRERILRAWRQSGELRWLLQVEGTELPAEAGLRLLAHGAFGNRPGLSEAEAAAWSRRLDPQTRARLLSAALRDPARQGDQTLLEGLGEELRLVLSELAADERFGEEARSLLLERAELSPVAALDLLRKGARGVARERLLALLAGAPASERPDPGAELALEWFQQGVSREEDSQLAEWLGSHPAVQAKSEEWLADPARRELGLRALCHGGTFERGRVQRLLGLAMSPELRARLAAAISRVSPERWRERYLLSAEEKAAWQAAGAPLL